jgi:integrase
MAKSKMKRKRAPKSVLKLPDLEQSKSAVLSSLTSPSSQRTYDHAIREFIEWYCSEPRLAFNKTVVTRYRISLEQQLYASTTINLRLAAVRRLAYEAADCGLLSADLAAGIRRVKGAKRLGVPVGNWLTAEQGKRLLRTVDCSSLRGKRDYATLAILLGCGLRRAELTTLRVEDIQQREDQWLLPTLLAKVDIFERFQCRIGLKQELMPGREIQIGRPLRLAIDRQLGCSFCRVPLKQACVGSGQCHPSSMPFSQQHGRGIH